MRYHLFTPPDFGLCNRLRGLVGEAAYAKRVGATLHVKWDPMPACPYRYEEMFEPLQNMVLISDVSDTTEYACKSTDVCHFNHVLSKYGVKLTPMLNALCIASLQPIASIRATLRELVVQCATAVGIHIRRTDLLEYTHKYGGPTPMEVYYKAAITNPDKRIFLACDDPDTLELFKNKFGNRVFTSMAFDAVPHEQLRKTSGVHAVLDLYGLAFCAFFQGTQHSSFTMHVCLLREAWDKVPSLLHKALAD